jgi:hypothetical protein
MTWTLAGNCYQICGQQRYRRRYVHACGLGRASAASGGTECTQIGAYSH